MASSLRRTLQLYIFMPLLKMKGHPLVIRKVIYSLFTFLLLMNSVVVTNAQQRPYYTQYIMNNYIINPAVAGIENYWDVKASHRMQWVGLQDAPVTTYLTFHGPLKKSDYERESATNFHAT